MTSKTFQGHVDQWTPRLEGWVSRTDLQDDPVTLLVTVDGEMISKVIADLPRPDVTEALSLPESCGFSVNLGEVFDDSNGHDIICFDVKTGQEVFRSPGVVCFASERPLIEEKAVGKDSILKVIGPEDGFRTSLVQLKKLALIATFRSPSSSNTGVELLAKELRACGFAVLIVDSSDTHFYETTSADLAICRTNVGYDFGSWYCGLQFVGDLAEIDELLLVNDSCFGPFGTLEKTFERLRGLDGDVVSLTEGWFGGFHLQSFFLLLKASALRMGALESFFKAYSFPRLKADIVREGEIGLSRHFLRRGLVLKALFDFHSVRRFFFENWRARLEDERNRLNVSTSSSDSRDPLPWSVDWLYSIRDSLVRSEPLNLTHSFWDVLVEMGMPFVKKDLLLKNPLKVPNLDQAGSLLNRCFGVSDFTLVNHELQARGVIPSQLSL